MNRPRQANETIALTFWIVFTLAACGLVTLVGCSLHMPVHLGGTYHGSCSFEREPAGVVDVTTNSLDDYLNGG